MREPLESLGRLRLQAVVMLAAVFVIGGLTGAALERLRDGQRHRQPRSRNERTDHRGLPRDLYEQLQLTDIQHRQVDSLLTDNRARSDSVMQAFMPRLQALTDSLRTGVRSLLDPEQQQVFDDYEARRGKRRQPPFPGGDRPDGRSRRHDDRRQEPPR